jgi:hypothetical protein
MHAHIANSSINMQHFVFGSLTLINNHHVGAAVEVGEGVGDASHFFAEGVM